MPIMYDIGGDSARPGISSVRRTTSIFVGTWKKGSHCNLQQPY